MQALDLGNLQDLFEDQIFREREQDDFFTDGMEQFLITKETPQKRQRTRTGTRTRIDVRSILPQIGESISRYIKSEAESSGRIALLEELQGDLPAELLPGWVAGFYRLRSLQVFKGEILDASVADAIRDKCPDFCAINVYNCVGEEVDSRFAAFISGLRPNSLRSLQVNSTNDLGGETFLALSGHRESLKELTIGNMKPDAVLQMALLSGCTALEVINLQDNTGTIDLENFQNDVFKEVVAWLSQCHKLSDIRLENFKDGPALLTAICRSDSIKLTSLKLVRYTLVGNTTFHRALALQPTLETLELRADAEDCVRDDIDTLVEALCQLVELKDLKLMEISEFFQNTQISQLAASLPLLEYFSVSGYGIDDAVFPALSTLHQLRSMAFHAMSSFSFTGLITYIERLAPSNAGLQLSVLSATQDSELTPAQQKELNDRIAAKVDGRFDFVLFREPESEGFSDSD